MKVDIHSEITTAIIDAIESAKGDFVMPWHRISLLPVKITDDTPYRGINILMLWARAKHLNYLSAQWGTFKAWKESGGYIKKGEKATRIVFYKSLERKNDKGEIETIPMPRYFNVWNREQVDGLEEPELTPVLIADASQTVKRIAQSNQAKVVENGQEAFYNVKADYINMPLPHLFDGRDGQTPDMGYASTLAHELVHWSGHSERQDRLNEPRTIENYGFEELVAELGSAFICAELGFSYNGVAGHAGYIESWLEVLKDDKKAIFRAASLASKATHYLLHDKAQESQS